MLAVSDTLYLSAKFQLLLTVCLVTLLWALYFRLQRFEFFRWWAWAWTAWAAYLATANVSLSLGHAWTPQKASLILIMLLSGFLLPVLLVCGGLSWRIPRKPFGRRCWWGIAIACSAAFACFATSFAFRAVPATSFGVRNIPRTLALSVALFFCCAVFWRQVRKNRSYASAITGMFCLSYALDQLFYFLNFSELLSAQWSLHFPTPLHALLNSRMFAPSKLLFFDLVDTCGICGGMILLLVERYQHTASELQLSERRRLSLAVDRASLQTEIQDHQQAEQALRHSEELSRQVVLNCPVAMLVSSGPREAIELFNEKFTGLFGYTLKDMRGVADWWPLAYPDPEYRQSVLTQWQKLIEKANQGSAEKLAMEARVRCKDGTFRDIEFHLSMVNDLYLVSFVDLTERKKAMEDLRESEGRYRDLVEHSVDLLGTHEVNGRILSINEAPCRQLGYTAEEVLLMSIQDLLAPRFRSLYPQFARRVLEKGSAKGLMTVVTRTGEERVWEYTSTLRRGGVPAPVIRGMAHDVTDRFRAEQALRLSEAK